MDPPAFEPVHEFEQVAGVPPQPVQLTHDQLIPRSRVFQELVQIRSPDLRLADPMIGVDHKASGLIKRRDLQIRVLLQSTDSRIPETCRRSPILKNPITSI